MTVVYESTQYSATCDIYALVYLNKLVARGAITVTPSNYQALWLACVLLANTVWGHDLQRRPRFGEIVSCFSSSILATLEQQVLIMLQNSVQVIRSLYAKYYFELSNYIFTTTLNNLEHNTRALTYLQAIFLNINVFGDLGTDKEYFCQKLNNFSIRDDIPMMDNKSLFVIRICG